jgi:hypothetical protein
MYTDALIMQDNVFSHAYFQRATRGALKIFLYLLDNPDDIDGLSNLPKEERKKERARIKKEKAKREKDEAKAAAAAAASSSSSSAQAEEKVEKKVDPDPLGEKILAKNFLEEANVFCKHIATRMQACDASTLALVAEVYLRRNKLVQVCRCVRLGLARAPHDPNLTAVLVKLLKRATTTATPAINETVLTTVNAELAALMEGQDLQTFVSKYIERTTMVLNSLPHRLGAAKALVLSASHKGLAAAKTRAAELVTEESLWASRGVSLENIFAVIKVSLLSSLFFLIVKISLTGAF